MDREIEERLERALSGYRRKREQFLADQRDRRLASATATSRDRLVTVTVDIRGNITALKFNSTGYTALDEAELAELILTTMTEARARVRGQGRQVVKILRPADTGSGEVADGGRPWHRVLPRAGAGGGPRARATLALVTGETEGAGSDE